MDPYFETYLINSQLLGLLNSFSVTIHNLYDYTGSSTTWYFTCIRLHSAIKILIQYIIFSTC